MAALGTNMGKKPEKENEAPSSKKQKKVVKTASSKKATATRQQTKKSKLVQAKKEVVTKPKVAKKPSTKPSPKKKQTRISAESSKSTIRSEAKVTKAPSTKKKDKKSAPKKAEPNLSLRNAKLILEPSKRRKIRKTKVILEGDLSINNVDAFMSQIEPIFDDYDYVDFFQREVTALDLCHIQMLYYFQNHPTRKGKTVTVNSDLPADLKKVVTNAGFKEFMFIPKLV